MGKYFPYILYVIVSLMSINFIYDNLIPKNDSAQELKKVVLTGKIVNAITNPTDEDDEVDSNKS